MSAWKPDTAAGVVINRNEEQVAWPEDRPCTINKFGQRWHSQRWTHDQNPNRQIADNRTNFSEGRGITRREQRARPARATKAITPHRVSCAE